MVVGGDRIMSPDSYQGKTNDMIISLNKWYLSMRTSPKEYLGLRLALHGGIMIPRNTMYVGGTVRVTDLSDPIADKILEVPQIYLLKKGQRTDGRPSLYEAMLPSFRDLTVHQCYESYDVCCINLKDKQDRSHCLRLLGTVGG
ncbi:hypothetical protein ACLOJK_005924 [Asimina triloba]